MKGRLASTLILTVLVGPGFAQRPQSSGDDAGDLEAPEFYEEILAERWTSTSGRPSAAMPVLEDLAALLTVAHFPDTDFETEVHAFNRMLESVGEDETFTEAFYVAAGRLLSRKGLSGVAEEVFHRGIEAFPDSRRLRADLAELYSETDRVELALDILAEVRDMGPGGDRALLEVRIGRLEVRLGRFDDAVAAFREASELAPDMVEARLELAGLYLGSDLLEEAEAEYARVLDTRPETADAYYGLAELNLRRNRAPEAVEAAGRALRIDPEHQRARYARARALIRAGRSPEAREELAAYRERADAARAALDREVELNALRQSAVAALLEGRMEEATALFREGIQAHPEAAALFFDLGVAQDRMDQGAAAAATFQLMLEQGCCPDGDSFLVHRSLARLRDLLGDTGASRRHRALYLLEYDSALRAASR